MADPIPIPDLNGHFEATHATGPVGWNHLVAYTPDGQIIRHYFTPTGKPYAWADVAFGHFHNEPFYTQMQACDVPLNRCGSWGERSDLHQFTVVPEPCTSLLLVAGLVGLAVIGRWRRG